MSWRKSNFAEYEILYIMTIKIFMTLTLTACFAWSASAIRSNNSKENVKAGSMKETPHNVCMADPTILMDGGVYYLYGTSGNSNNGFESYYSKDLENWEGPVEVLKKGDAFGTAGFWAPQVLKTEDGRYAMIYTANERIAMAWADSPLGPFRNDSRQCIADDMRRIDPFVFRDTDGKTYLYHVRLDNGNKIYTQSISQDLDSTDLETLSKVIEVTLPWENTEDSSWPVTEGPTVVKHGGRYYLFYSANDFRNRDYAVGYAVADSPEGPWVKNPEPIITRFNTGLPGTGHGDIFIDMEGKFKYVFHSHNSQTEVAPRKTYIVGLTLDSMGAHIDPLTMMEIKTSTHKLSDKSKRHGCK